MLIDLNPAVSLSQGEVMIKLHQRPHEVNGRKLAPAVAGYHDALSECYCGVVSAEHGQLR